MKPTEQKNQTVEELLELYFTECEHIRRLRPQTIKSYKELFSGFLKIMPEIKFVSDLSRVTLNIFFNRISAKTSDGVKTSTIRTYFDKIMVFFRWLESYEFVSPGSLSQGSIKPPRPNYEDSRSLSTEQISKIISSIAQDGINSPLQFKRDMLIINLLLNTGIRRGELLGIKISDVNWETRILKVDGETSKSKRSRNIPINSTLFQSLISFTIERKSHKIRSDYLIVSIRRFTPLTQDGLKHWVNKYVKLSGVRFSLHQFRHTFACTLAKNNTDISSIKGLLGHRNSSTTERYLRSIKPEDARDQLELLQF